MPVQPGSAGRAPNRRAESAHVLFLVPYPVGFAPGQRFRVEQWLQHLTPGLIEPTIQPLLSADAYGASPMRRAASALFGSAKRVAALLRTRRWDAVYVYREALFAGPPVVERVLASRI